MKKQIENFDWDEENIAHIARNHVEDYEVEYVILFDKPFFRKTREGKYVAFGVTEVGRYLFVVFALKGEKLIRVITARDMIPRERSDYIKNRREKMNKKIPKFRSEEEEAEFWSKNTPLDYSDEFIDEKEPFKFAVNFLKKAAQKQKEKKTLLTFRMEASQVILIKLIAKKLGEEHYQALMRKWLREKMLEILAENPRIEQEIRKQQPHFLNT